MRAKMAICSFCSLALIGQIQAAIAQARPTGTFELNRILDLPPGPLSQSLNQLSGIYEINVLFASDLMTGREAVAIRGHFTFDEALKQLLEGQGLRAVRVDSDTIAIVVAERTNLHEPARPRVPAWLRTAPVSPLQSDATLRAETVIVTGTRAPTRTVFESLAPIDVISGADLGETVSDELLDSLAQSLPGFTAFRFPLNDGNIFNRPTALRGLSSDQTLVLVNGRRRHRSAFLETTNGQPVDLSQIPITAIKRVEILRDGASAQYGSDAIGGVINIILEDEPGASAFAQYSTYYEGDGEVWRAGVRDGWVFEGAGFLTLSAEAFNTAPTSRARQRTDAIAFQASHPDVSVPDPVQRWGQPERDGWRIGWNGAVASGASVEAYSFGTYSETNGLSDFNWRNPDTSLAYDPSTAFPDFDLQDVYPAGFTPRFGQEERDVSAFMGVRAGAGAPMEWDVSAGFGQSQIDYVLLESINASLGPDSPTGFHPGTLRQTEGILNADVSMPVGKNRAAGTGNLAAGVELRRERYAIEAGDVASYAVGPGALDGLPPGSNGFPGYSPEQAGTFEQDSYAGWVDLEWPVTRAWTFGTALRYENYSIFGDTLNGKLSGRYEVTPEWVLRGTISTGFRAPTPGQVYSQRTSQSLDTETLVIASRGRFSPVGPVAEILSRREDLSIEPLKAERSANYSIGFGYRGHGGLTATVDAFQIDVYDRFDEISGITLTDEERAALAVLDPMLNPNISTVNFFQNVYDSRTLGIEAVVAYERRVGAGDLSLTLAYTTLDTDVTKADMPTGEAERQFFENPVPEHRAAISAAYSIARFELSGRLRYFGSWSDVNGSIESDYQTFGDRTFLDAGLAWHAADQLTLKLGVENFFNVYPDEARRQANRGLVYSRNAPYDTDGGLVYARVTRRF